MKLKSLYAFSYQFLVNLTNELIATVTFRNQVWYMLKKVFLSHSLLQLL